MTPAIKTQKSVKVTILVFLISYRSGLNNGGRKKEISSQFLIDLIANNRNKMIPTIVSEFIANHFHMSRHNY